jgi:hypothetical protein
MLLRIPRLHLLELEEQEWLPRRIRNLATDYLCFLEAKLKMHRLVVPVLAQALRKSGTGVIIDLCAGGSGPILPLLLELSDDGLTIRATLTDRYPNLDAFERVREASAGAIDYVREPIDARSIPPTLVGFRTFYNAFHHFKPHEARGILEDAVAANQPVGVFELTGRSYRMIASMSLVPLMVLLATPFIRPLRWERLLWTYLVPFVPLVCFWDGFVSQLRSYTVEELRGFADGVESPDYVWEVGESRMQPLPGKVTYLVGYPTPARARPTNIGRTL